MLGTDASGARSPSIRIVLFSLQSGTRDTTEQEARSAMAKGRSQLVGAAGQFYLSYGLAVREINASPTLGNAPSVDVLACSPDGRHSLSFQVKTSRNAYRPNCYGDEGYLWDVGAGVIGQYRESFWYAFIDLQEHQEGSTEHKKGWTPVVFFVPSRWVAEFVKPDFTRFMYFLPTKAKCNGSRSFPPRFSRCFPLSFAVSRWSS
jgi:hypothetical protein